MNHLYEFAEIDNITTKSVKVWESLQRKRKLLLLLRVVDWVEFFWQIH